MCCDDIVDFGCLPVCGCIQLPVFATEDSSYSIKYSYDFKTWFTVLLGDVAENDYFIFTADIVPYRTVFIKILNGDTEVLFPPNGTTCGKFYSIVDKVVEGEYCSGVQCSGGLITVDNTVINVSETGHSSGQFIISSFGQVNCLGKMKYEIDYDNSDFDGGNISIFLSDSGGDFLTFTVNADAPTPGIHSIYIKLTDCCGVLRDDIQILVISGVTCTPATITEYPPSSLTVAVNYNWTLEYDYVLSGYNINECGNAPFINVDGQSNPDINISTYLWNAVDTYDGWGIQMNADANVVLPGSYQINVIVTDCCNNQTVDSFIINGVVCEPGSTQWTMGDIVAVPLDQLPYASSNTLEFVNSSNCIYELSQYDFNSFPYQLYPNITITNVSINNNTLKIDYVVFPGVNNGENYLVNLTVTDCCCQSAFYNFTINIVQTLCDGGLIQGWDVNPLNIPLDSQSTVYLSLSDSVNCNSEPYLVTNDNYNINGVNTTVTYDNINDRFEIQVNTTTNADLGTYIYNYDVYGCCGIIIGYATLTVNVN